MDSDADSVQGKRQKIMDKYDILKQYFGHTEFRQGQEELIDNILNGRDVIGIMPTGAGKSLCYQVPAMLLEGITIVVYAVPTVFLCYPII